MDWLSYVLGIGTGVLIVVGLLRWGAGKKPYESKYGDRIER